MTEKPRETQAESHVVELKEKVNNSSLMKHRADAGAIAAKNAVEPSPRPVARLIIGCTSPGLCSMKSSACVSTELRSQPWLESSGWRGGTIARWLESAATYAVRFNDRMLRGFVIHELQADEIRTFVGAKKRVIWVLTTLEVWSRLWVSTNVGRRSLQQIKNAILNTLQRGLLKHRFLFTTDGFEMYEWAAKRLLLGVCIYGQVIKKRRENRVVRVDRRLLLGTQGELEAALFHSEDSSTLNTSFVERHNLTIRQGCSYLGRRTPCHARRTEFLEGHVALLMAYYNFVRPHSALRFGASSGKCC